MAGKLVLAAVLASVSLSSTVAFAKNPSPDAAPAPDVVWFVVGVKPANVRLEVDEPRLANNVAWSFRYSLDSYTPDDGFIVVKAKPDKIYGIAASSLMAGKSIFGIRYKPCGAVPAFKGAGGKVLYFSSVEYRSAGAGSTGFGTEFFEDVRYSRDIEAARSFLKTHYPALAGSLEQGPTELLQLAHKCPGVSGPTELSVAAERPTAIQGKEPGAASSAVVTAEPPPVVREPAAPTSAVPPAPVIVKTTPRTPKAAAKGAHGCIRVLTDPSQSSC